MAETPAPVIRLATVEDAPTILALIHELAAFEKKSDRVKATVKTIADTLTFAASPSNPSPKTRFAKCFLMIAPPSATAKPTSIAKTSDDAVAGMALYTFNYSTWLSQPGIYLEDLFVRPQYRHRGYATMLFGALAREAAETAGGSDTRLEWSCLKWNEGALKFYDGLGAERKDEEWYGLRLEGDALRKLANE